MRRIKVHIERHLRVYEAAEITRYTVAAIRAKLSRGEIGHRKCGRLILIPLSEVQRIMGEYRPPVQMEGGQPKRGEGK
jgi:excisionase family DNA binding protein